MPWSENVIKLTLLPIRELLARLLEVGRREKSRFVQGAGALRPAEQFEVLGRPEKLASRRILRWFRSDQHEVQQAVVVPTFGEPAVFTGTQRRALMGKGV